MTPNGWVSNGGVSRSGLVLPFLSFLGTFPIFRDFPDLLGLASLKTSPPGKITRKFFFLPQKMFGEQCYKNVLIRPEWYFPLSALWNIHSLLSSFLTWLPAALGCCDRHQDLKIPRTLPQWPEPCKRGIAKIRGFAMCMCVKTCHFIELQGPALEFLVKTCTPQNNITKVGF